MHPSKKKGKQVSLVPEISDGRREISFAAIVAAEEGKKRIAPLSAGIDNMQRILEGSKTQRKGTI